MGSLTPLRHRPRFDALDDLEEIITGLARAIGCGEDKRSYLFGATGVVAGKRSARLSG